MKAKDTDVLYIIKQKYTKFYKIGITTEFKKKGRFAQLQTASPTGIQVVDLFYLENAISNERKLHSLFSKFRLNGEWFFIEDYNSNFIKSNMHGLINKNNPLDFKEINLIGRHKKNIEEFEPKINSQDIFNKYRLDFSKFY